MKVASAAIGYAAFAGFLVACLMLVWRRACRAGVAAPVVVGFGLRLLLVLVIHLVALDRTDGFMFLDDRTYFAGAERLAGAWRAGLIVSPSGDNFVGSYQFGYPALLALALTLAGGSTIPGALVNVVVSTVTILLVALIAERVFGSRTRVRAAWLAALLPGPIWWAVPLVKETFAAFLMAALVLAILHVPRAAAVAVAAAASIALAVTRAAGGIAVVAAAGVTYLALAFLPGEGIPLRRLGAYVAAAALWLVAVVMLVSGGEPTALFASYSSSLRLMIERYQGSEPALIPIDVARSLISPYPWVFQATTDNWDRGLYPGMWAWYGLYPSVALGVWSNRRRPEVLMLAGLCVVFLTLNAFAAGYQFRQRSSIEAFLVVLAVGGMRSWRQAAALAAAAWAVIAVAAALQSRGPTAPAIILVGAALLWLVSRRLPATPLDVRMSVEPMRSGLRELAAWTPRDAWRQLLAARSR